MSSWAAEQFHSDASLKAVDRRAPKSLKNWQWATEGDVSMPQLTPAPHGGELQYSFLQAVSSMLVYCYRCTNFGFVKSLRWIVCKGAFIQDPSHDKPMRLQWTHEHRARQAHWHQIVFLDKSRFSL
ncbi:uncharacterized protein TNCV_2262591 [Trichonephila clavipes]|nr:uncharacterized protein TNCV_2262591 [Trichonephila clavipes]